MTSAPMQMPTSNARKPRFTPHDFDDEDAFMADGGVADFVDGVHGGVDCGVKPDGFVGAVDVVVYSGWNSNNQCLIYAA